MQFDILDAMEQKIASQRRTIWIVLVLCFLVIAAFVFRASVISEHASQMEVARNSLSEKVKLLRGELRELRTRNAELVADRLPGLLQVEYGEIIEKPADYVDSVLLTRTQAFEGDRYEYLAIIKNSSNDYVTPEIKLTLFNTSGYQVGGAVISSTATSLQQRRARLKPGDSRSYSGILDIESNEVPPYFRIWTELQ